MIWDDGDGEGVGLLVMEVRIERFHGAGPGFECLLPIAWSSKPVPTVCHALAATFGTWICKKQKSKPSVVKRKTIILACMPFRYHATAMRTSPALGHVPLPPPRQHRTAAAPQLHTAPTTATNFALHFDFDIPTSPAFTFLILFFSSKKQKKRKRKAANFSNSPD